MSENKLAISFGILAGLLFTIINFACWWAGIEIFSTFLLWYSWLPVIFIIVLTGAFFRRKQLGGYMSFKEGITFCFLAYLIFEVFYAITTLVLFRFIDPQLQEKVFAVVVEKTRKFMEGIGAPDSKIEDALEKAKAGNQSKYTVGQVVMGFGLALLFDFVKSLIIAAIAQRRRPEFAPIKESNL